MFSGRIIQALYLVGVELEEVGDDFGFWHVGYKAVGGKHGAVVRLVRGAVVGRHRERVVALSYAFSLSCQ